MNGLHEIHLFVAFEALVATRTYADVRDSLRKYLKRQVLLP